MEIELALWARENFSPVCTKTLTGFATYIYAASRRPRDWSATLYFISVGIHLSKKPESRRFGVVHLVFFLSFFPCSIRMIESWLLYIYLALLSRLKIPVHIVHFLYCRCSCIIIPSRIRIDCCIYVFLKINTHTPGL